MANIKAVKHLARSQMGFDHSVAITVIGTGQELRSISAVAGDAIVFQAEGIHGGIKLIDGANVSAAPPWRIKSLPTKMPPTISPMMTSTIESSIRVKP